MNTTLYESLDGSEFADLFTGFRKSAIRLQTLPKYDITGEQLEYNQFLAGKPLPDVDADEWFVGMADAVASGKTWSNIHILPPLLTPYLKYLIEW